ncbi:MAG: Recombination protein [Bacteroidota bacterium]|jgi:DNA repair protein RecO (recombination protein O)
MILNCSGIVLSSLRYSDSSVIARIYTKEKGLRSFMVRTGKGKAALSKLGLLQPLSLVSVSFANDERKNLHTLRNIERECGLRSIPFDPVKTCIALFVSEIISRSIGEEETNTELFKFLHSSVLLLDDHEDSPANFHLKFMIEFSRFLGFYPQSKQPNQAFFDLAEGEFTSSEPIHPHVILEPLSTVFNQLILVGMSGFDKVKMSNEQRRMLVQKLIDFFRFHLEGMKEISSHKVLEEVLS